LPEGFEPLNWAAAIIAIVVGVVGMGMMFVMAAILAPRKRSADKALPYESGIRPAPYTWSQVHIRYYVFAILFLVFDVEAVFIFPWAVVFLSVKQGVGELFTQAVANAVFYEMILFIAILAFGILYGWRKGVLHWR